MTKAARNGNGWYYSTAAAVPVLAAAFASIMLAGIVLRWVTTQTDELAEVAQRRAVQYALDAKAARVADDQREALRSETDAGGSGDFAVAERLATVYRHDRVYLLTPDHRPVAFWANGKAQDMSRTDQVVPKLADLTHMDLTGSSTEPATQLAKIEGNVAVVGTLGSGSGSRNAIVSVRFLDDAFLHDSASRSSLGAIAVRNSDIGGADHSLTLRSTNGTPLAYIVWDAEKPGSRMLAAFWPVAAVSALAAVLVMSLLVRHLDRTTAELKKREAEARALALHDPLTGLANRQHLNQHLEAALLKTRTGEDHVAILCLDLDRFKLVNDTLGHPAGDRLLREFAQRLGKVVRNSDFIARVGGDEFIIVQHGVHRTRDAIALCERILAAAREAFDLEGTQAFVGVSIGVVRSPASGTDPAELLRMADIALYEAKSEGRACYRLFDNDMDDRVRVRSAVENDLRDALERGEGLQLLYQPLIATQTRETVAVEALLRWQHPSNGHVDPAQFIPVAEETGLIHELGDWVMREACAFAARWPKLRMAVNLSPVQFRDTALPERLLAIALSAGVEPARLDLEITEGVFFSGEQNAVEMLRRLREYGFRIALDDFGAGYSSLSYLTRFKIDKIKIDQSFIQRLGPSPEAIAVVQAVTALGSSLKLLVTAEGVETHDQAQILATIGVDEMQGYLFARPMSDVDLSARLAAPKALRLVVSAA